MPTITCTPGGSTDNCYISLSDANGYYDDTLRESDWLANGTADRERALIQATQAIERLGGAKIDELSPARSRFRGTPKNTSEYDSSSDTWVLEQALHFPTKGDADANSDLFIPKPIEDAVCEQALYLLERQDGPQLVDRQALQAAGVESFSVDGMSESYRQTSKPIGIAPRAWGHIKPYIIRTGRTRV